MAATEEELPARVNRKKYGLFSNVIGKTADDIDEFLALEKIAEMRKEFGSIGRLNAAFGSWNRFIEYDPRMLKQRNFEAEERQRQIVQTIR